MFILTMHFCRICRTDKNLKYSKKELQRLIEKKTKNVPKELFESASTLGNICYDCEKRRLTFHTEEGDNSDVDIECSPLVITKQDKNFSAAMACNTILHHRQLRGKSLGSDGNAEVIDLLTSRECSPTTTISSRESDVELIGQNTIDLLCDKENDHMHVMVNISISDTETEPDLLPTKKSFTFTLKDSSLQNDLLQDLNPEEPEKTAISIDNTTSNIAPEVLVQPSDKSCKLKETTNNRRISNRNILKQPVVLKTPSNGINSNATQHKQVEKSILLTQTTDIQNQQQPTDKQLRQQTTGKKYRQQSTEYPVLCTVCSNEFRTEVRHVDHMRKNHRGYHGEILEELTRHSQDNAMTIRLLYKQQTHFFECQLCGRIDTTYPQHKSHIADTHPYECELLKDTFLKTIKCPLCKEECGKQAISLCRHFLNCHSPLEYKCQLFERTSYSGGPRTVHQTARIYQLKNRTTFFIECKQCGHVDASSGSHLKHLNKEHSDIVVPAAKRTRTQRIKIPVQRDTPTPVKPKNYKPHLQAQRNAQPTKNVSAVALCSNESMVANSKLPKKTATKKPKEPANQSPKRTLKRKRPQNETLQIKLAIGTPKTPSPLKRLRRIVAKKSVITPKYMTRKVKIPITKKPNAKITKKALQAALVRANKPPIIQLPRSKFTCKYCPEKFIGFMSFNFHMISVHAAEEFHNSAAEHKRSTNKNKNCQYNRRKESSRTLLNEKFPKEGSSDVVYQCSICLIVYETENDQDTCALYHLAKDELKNPK